MRKSKTSAVPTTSTTGATAAITATTIRLRRATARATWSATTTWMTTVTGVLTANTETFGFPELRWDGRHITTATGPGSIPGDGPGSTMPAGDTRPFTTAAGFRSKAAGDGFLVRSPNVRCMLRRWLS